jgi:hypothetical protein
MANKLTDEAAVNDKIASLPAFRDVAARLHEVVMAAAPHLQPRLWYGMPGYATSTVRYGSSSSWTSPPRLASPTSSGAPSPDQSIIDASATSGWVN